MFNVRDRISLLILSYTYLYINKKIYRDGTTLVVFSFCSQPKYWELDITVLNNTIWLIECYFHNTYIEINASFSLKFQHSKLFRAIQENSCIILIRSIAIYIYWLRHSIGICKHTKINDNLINILLKVNRPMENERQFMWKISEEIHYTSPVFHNYYHNNTILKFEYKTLFVQVLCQLPYIEMMNIGFSYIKNKHKQYLEHHKVKIDRCTALTQ